MLATTTTEPASPDIAADDASSRQGRIVAWIAALAAPAVVGPLWCWLIPTWWGSLSSLILLLALATCAVTDTWHRRIPNWATYSAVLWGLAINLWATLAADDSLSARLVGPSFLGAVGIQDAALGLGIALLFGLPCYFAKMLAAGDVKLAALIATLLGWKLGLMAFSCGFIVAGAAAACWAVWQLGPLSAIEWFLRTIGFQLLPTIIAPPSEELRAIDRPLALGIFFAIGVPLALVCAGVS